MKPLTIDDLRDWVKLKKSRKADLQRAIDVFGGLHLHATDVLLERMNEIDQEIEALNKQINEMGENRKGVA